MAVLALLDVSTYVDGHDFTTDTNQAQLATERTALDKTTFGSNGWTELAGGLKSWTFNMQGFWQSATSDAVDPESFPNLGISNRVFTMCPAETEAQPAYMAQGGSYSYQLGGQLGELAPFTLASQGTSGQGVVRGQLAKARGVVSATGALGSAVNLGAGAAGKFLYAAFHVFVVGTTITLEIQGDNAQAFTTPTTVVGSTLGPLTTRGGTWLTRIDATAITDTWFRFNVTANTGTHTVAGAIGIQ